MPSTEFRLAVPGDAQAIAEIQLQSWMTLYPNESLGITRADIEAMDLAGPVRLGRWAAILAQQTNEQRSWVAEVSGIVVGYAMARREGEWNRIWVIHVLPEFQSQGIGSRFMDIMLAWLGSDKPVRLSVAPYNERAIRFYEKFGFFRTDQAKHSPLVTLPSGRQIPEIEMQKPPL